MKMAKKTEKTNAARLLDKAGIEYNLIPYDFDENDLAAQHVAESLGQPIERVSRHSCSTGTGAATSYASFPETEKWT